MSIMERGRRFAQWLRGLAERTPWEERRCPTCRGHDSWKHGSYRRHPWTLAGRQAVRVQRYWCRRCRRTFTPALAAVERRRRYGRDVRRLAIDHWQHAGSSLRRTAELVRSLIGRQERWCIWRPWEPLAAGRCPLSGSTVGRWLDDAGQRAAATVRQQLVDVPQSGQVGADGLWATLAGKAKAVVLLLVDRLGAAARPAARAGQRRGAGVGALRRGAAGLGASPTLRLPSLAQPGTPPAGGDDDGGDRRQTGDAPRAGRAGARRPGRGGRRGGGGRPPAPGRPSAGGGAGDGAGDRPGACPGVPFHGDRGLGPGGAGMVLARLPLTPQSRAQPPLPGAAGAGGAALGALP